MTEIAEVLGPNGLLAARIRGFRHRSQQQAMAEAVAQTLDRGETLICEAGTGTGKTFAYLVPALLADRKVIISTGTRNLQDQLFHRDLPVVRDTLKSPVKTALLKGRANYLCRHRMDNALHDGRHHGRELARQLRQVRDWSVRTRRGDIAELALPEQAPVWPWVTSTTDNCLGQECPDWHRCHLVEARRRAQEADLVVVNHYLLCADMELKEGGFGEILPGADCFILDEAHQLPEVAGQFFGSSLSGRQLLDLARDVETEYHREAGDLPEVLDKAQGLRKAAQDLRLSFGVEPRRGPWREIANERDFDTTLTQLTAALDQLGSQLQVIEGRGKGLDSCHARCCDLQQSLKELSIVEDDNHVRWYETQKTSFRLNRTPLEIADTFRGRMASHKGAWIFTSATLAVGDSFEHFAKVLGIPEAVTQRWDSPFDYPHQALWFVPRGMPDPNTRDYTAAVTGLTEKVVEYSRGRAFLLFTSHRALQQAAELLQPRLPYPLLVQGEAPRAELLQRFRDLGNAVLLGTASFWEGVDVRGEALSCVIIDKLPFASPGDPVLQARIDALRQQGGNPFREFQLPQAVIALKQGAGRLIRDATDRGVLVVCDPRLLSRSYGHAFLNSLPPMARSRDIAEVARFFRAESADPPETSVRETP